MIPLSINKSNISRDFSLQLSKCIAESDLVVIGLTGIGHIVESVVEHHNLTPPPKSNQNPYIMSTQQVKYYIVHMFFYHLVDISAGGILVPEGITRPVVNVSTLIWFIIVVIGLTGIGPIREISVLDWFLPYWPNKSFILY
jgi:hypothetical protein